MKIFLKFQGEKPVPEERLKRLPELIESWFCFAIVWGLGATCDNNGRLKFDQWMRERMNKAGVSDFIQLKMLLSGFCSCFHDDASQLIQEAGDLDG